MFFFDESMQAFPLESMKSIHHLSSSRMLGLSHLLECILRQDGSEGDSFFQPRELDAQKGWYAVDIHNNLSSTQEIMKDYFSKFQQNYDWTGFIGQVPSKEEVKDCHEGSDYFVYCGHGSGDKLYSKAEVETEGNFPACFLWGCSSARMKDRGSIHEPSGPVKSLLHKKKAPFVVGNLWDVTDRDLDKLSVDCMERYFDPANQSSMNKALFNARKVCKLSQANGSAPVLYGLPLQHVVSS